MDKQWVLSVLLGGPDARNFLALPPSQIAFPLSTRVDATFVLGQPWHVPTQGVLGELAVRESYFLSISLLCLLLILTFSHGLLSFSFFCVLLSATNVSDKVQEWLSKFSFFLTLIISSLPKEKFQR